MVGDDVFVVDAGNARLLRLRSAAGVLEFREEWPAPGAQRVHARAGTFPYVLVATAAELQVTESARACSCYSS